MKISDALLYTIYKNNNKMTSAELLNYMKQLLEYEMVEINKDGMSFSLSNKGLGRLENNGLLNKL